ncbi:MAG TPA: response regulator transcription factor [Verrucomicrobiae bacterium]|jgi:DNA-binding NarL/FixJ family response regulator|nr:response regulator transcription factor [Verrucomicrobiae bacterium]
MSETPSQKSRILIVDDHPLFREGLRQMIERNPEWTVCGEAADAAEALAAIPAQEPDLVMVDISLGGASGLDLIKSVKAQYEELPVLVISMHDESLFAQRAIRAKAMGYVMKHEPAKTVQAAISKVLAGNLYLSDAMSTAMLSKFMLGKEDEPRSATETLSDRELEVFRMLGKGRGTRQIAGELNLTIATINSFRARIKEKLGVKSSSELVLHAMRYCLEESSSSGG